MNNMHLSLFSAFSLYYFVGSQFFGENNMGVNITNWELRENNFFNDSYDNNNDFYYSKTLNGSICNIKKCIRICCELNDNVFNKTCVHSSSTSGYKFHKGTILSENVVITDFNILFGKTCPKNHLLIKSRHSFFLQEDGTLFVPNFNKIYNFEEYCLNTSSDEIAARLCEFYDEQLSEQNKINIMASGIGK